MASGESMDSKNPEGREKFDISGGSIFKKLLCPLSVFLNIKPCTGWFESEPLLRELPVSVKMG